MKKHKFHEYANINQDYWNQRTAAGERLRVFDDGENESLEDDVRSFVDKTTHFTTAVLCDNVGRQCWDDSHKARNVIKFFLRPMSVEVILSRSLTEAVRDASLFSPCLCFTSSVAVRSVWLLRVMQDPCLFVHDTRICFIKAQSLFSGRSQLFSA